MDEVLNYNHDVYAPYNPTEEEEWTDIKPAVTDQRTIAQLLDQIIDTTSLEVEYGSMKFYVDFGILDDMIEKASTANAAKMERMRTAYDHLGEELKRIHERNHNIALTIGGGRQAPSGAQASYWGVTHQHSSGQAFHHNSTYGQGYMPQQQRPGNPLKEVGKSLFTGFTGIPLQHQQQGYYPQQQGYPPQGYRPY